MHQPPLQHTAPWYRALTFAERAATLPIQALALTPEARQRALHRLRRWYTESPCADPAVWTQRLALEGLDAEQGLTLLGEDLTALHERLSATPPWMTALAHALDPGSPGSAGPGLAGAPGSATAGFLTAITPLIQPSIQRLRVGIETLIARYPHAPFAPETAVTLLTANVPSRLLPLLSRTFVLELHVARLQGVLEGETPAARFQHFLHRLGQPDGLRELCTDYPVLARQLVTTLEHWVEGSLTFLAHLCADWPTLCHTFGLEPAHEVLVAAKDGAGDTHRHGRSVIIVQWLSGRQLVYKPRSLAVEAHFQDLLRWLNARVPHGPFRTLTLLTRPQHGWMEYVQATACPTPAHVAAFYQRLGGYLALLYALEGVDLHYENLIAAGEHPVLVDLETLFHPTLAPAPAQPRPQEVTEDTVLRVGLLPQRWGGTDTHPGMDISGLGAVPGQLTPHVVPRLDGDGTDTMRYVRQHVALSPGQHRPTLNGQAVSWHTYRADVTAGFQTMYRVLLQHRDTLLAPHGPLAWFATDTVRVLARPTAFYAQLLTESFHPDVLRDALDRDRHFDALWLGTRQQPSLVPLIPHERRALEQGDVPLLTTSPQSRQVWSSEGPPIADVLLRESGLQRVQQRLRRFSEADLARQQWILEAALNAESLGQGLEPPRRDGLPRHASPATAAPLLDAACALGDHLAQLAFCQGDGATWLGLLPTAAGHWSVQPVGVDLYSGSTGIALFLAYLGALTDNARYTALARATLAGLRRHLAAAAVPNIGAFEGWGGLIYVYTHLGILWHQPALLADAETLTAQVAAGLASDTRFDLLSGAAGALLALRSLYACRPAARTLALLVRCGEHLLAHTRVLGPAMACPAPVELAVPLAGLSHGAAGIAWAFSELAGLTGEPRWRQAAVHAMAYERSLFDAQARNWPDLRAEAAGNTAGGVSCMSAWCHGAPGVGLARLQILRQEPSAAVRTEIDHALHTTLADGFGHNHSLCHGDLGNVELLLQASLQGHAPHLRATVQHLAGRIVASLATAGWQCGVPQGAETPGLMIGLAGIGYGLLRLARPQKVPAVLTLEPPTGA